MVNLTKRAYECEQVLIPALDLVVKRLANRHDPNFAMTSALSRSKGLGTNGHVSDIIAMLAVYHHPSSPRLLEYSRG